MAVLVRYGLQSLPRLCRCSESDLTRTDALVLRVLVDAKRNSWLVTMGWRILAYGFEFQEKVGQLHRDLGEVDCTKTIGTPRPRRRITAARAMCRR